ncbi:MAG: hypothetical protein JNK58_05455 [Phycisphaerae bacterium]|nr:hypothetical protein [Phycisphaerae bacterium]
MSESAVMVLGTVGALSIFASLLSFVLRWAAVPGGRSAAAIVAGISVGLLAGPGVLGRGWPGVHERVILGGAAEQEAISEVVARHRGELRALSASGVSAAALEEHRARQAEALRPMEARRDAARAERRVIFDWWAQGFLALYLALIGAAIVPSERRRAPITEARDGWHGWERWFGRAVGVGFAASAMSCVVPVVLGGWWMGLSGREAVAFALILGAPGVAATLRPGVFVASAVGVFACVSVAVLVGWSIGMTIAATGLCLGLMAGFGFDDARTARRVRRWGVAAAHGVALPTAAAILAVHVDLHALMGGSAWRFWWAAVIAVIWSSDGRWLSWMLALRWLGRGEARRRAWSASAACVNAGTGVTQVGLTIVLSASGLADGSVVSAGLLGAALVEVTRGMREWMGGRLDDHGEG